MSFKSIFRAEYSGKDCHHQGGVNTFDFDRHIYRDRLQIHVCPIYEKLINAIICLATQLLTPISFMRLLRKINSRMYIKNLL